MNYLCVEKFENVFVFVEKIKSVCPDKKNEWKKHSVLTFKWVHLVFFHLHRELLSLWRILSHRVQMLLETTDISAKDVGRRSLVFLNLKQIASTWLGELMHKYESENALIW